MLLCALPAAPACLQVLAADAVEDERAWGELAAEEAQVQVEVAEAIWQDLLADTAQAVADLERHLGAGRGLRPRLK